MDCGRMANAWRMMRALRLYWLLVLVICALASLNFLISSNTSQLQALVELSAQDGAKREQRSEDVGIQRVFPARPLGQAGQLPPHAPLVKKELSLGVWEEENSAREVMDVEGGEREVRQGHSPDFDAANEVNSVEPDTNGAKASKRGKHNLETNEENQLVEAPLGNWRTNNWRNMTTEEVAHLSALGRRLFLNESVGTLKGGKTFTLLVWKSGPSLERRLLREFGKVKKDPFRHCSAQNCRLTYEDAAAADADAILFHLHRTAGPHSFPNRTRHDQRWIWLTDESPYNTFMMAKDKRMSSYNGFFNWSMNYRMDSDIPVPYGRTVPLSPEEAAAFQPLDYASLKPKLVTIVGSHCSGSNKRWNYVKELQKHIPVDVYGRCGPLKCPGHYDKECSALTDYKFYLSFENGDCQEYITEKAWWNALGKGAIPVVMGPRIEQYRKILPPDSFLHVDEFPSPKSLAERLTYLANHPEELNRYHAWRSRFRVLNEHGYFNSPVFHYCRICEALNYNSPKPKMYNNLQDHWNKNTQCYKTTWDERMSSSPLAGPRTP